MAKSTPAEKAVKAKYANQKFFGENGSKPSKGFQQDTRNLGKAVRDINKGGKKK